MNLSFNPPAGENDQSSAELRTYTRIDAKLNVRYKIVKTVGKQDVHPDQTEHLSVTKSVSAGGVLFVSDESLPVATILELKLELPGEEKPIECLARVARVEEIDLEKIYHIGVYFLDVSGSQRLKIDAFVEKRV